MYVNLDVYRKLAALHPVRRELENGDYVMERPRQFAVPMMQTDGEQRRWLNPLKERAVIVGGKCPNCGQIVAPMYMERCNNPECRFALLEPVDLPDRGFVAGGVPSVVLFAPMNMNGKAPYGHGHIFLSDGVLTATTAMLMPFRSTKGPMRDGVFGPEEAVKVVFRNDRDGWITDMFAVPAYELTEEQLQTSPLFAEDLDWSALKQKPIFEPNATYVDRFPEILAAMQEFCDQVNSSERAQKILNRNDFAIDVHTAGGDFCIVVTGGRINVMNGRSSLSTTEFAIADPEIFCDWTTGTGIIDAIAEGTLWFPDRTEEEGGQFELRLVEELDRLYRATFLRS